MRLSQTCWLATGVYAMHILEEFVLNWRDWVRDVMHVAVEWPSFYVTNAVVIVLGVVAAEVASQFPMLALSFLALMLINATFFHLAPFLAKRGRFSPGLITAVLLFYPVGIWGYTTAMRAGVLTKSRLWGSFLIGALLMAAPVILQRIKGLPYFVQNSEDSHDRTGL